MHRMNDGDLAPWRLDDADDLNSSHRLGIGMSASTPLVPFAQLIVGEGESACFVGSDTSGDPAVRILVLDHPGRFYTFPSFSIWHRAALEHFERWKAGRFNS